MSVVMQILVLDVQTNETLEASALTACWEQSTSCTITKRLMLTSRDLKIGLSLCSVLAGPGCFYFIVPSGARLCVYVSTQIELIQIQAS
jgi:hypothetical protein